MGSSTVWSFLVVPYAAAAVLLVVAGAPKVLDPGDLHRAVRSVGMPVGRTAVRAFALAEVVVGLVALTLPGRATAALLGVLYAGFTAFVVVALGRGGVLSSCGCFGKADTPPTRAHALLTAAAALVGLAVAAAPPGDPWGSLTPASAGGVVALVALVGFLAWQVMAVLPSVDPRAVRSGTRG
ncbi:MauE/DoxX family redox-associated membrane protein [Oryzobacter terrae]|uniref:MauE/DoxX family redox-associated membrane protein n=1 Tax=Oryzobacter terrae TaxID=1620385 RepID=UPI00366DB2D2